MKSGDFTQTGATVEAWRMVDACANRAAEALRVIEDVVRFVVDDAYLTGVAKDLRHDLAAVLADGLSERVFARDVSGDVGAGRTAAAAWPRATASDVIAANAARAAQALRSLEECASLVHAPAVGRFEPLRYRLYLLERAALVAVRSRHRLSDVMLCVLVDGCDDAATCARLVESLVEAGVRMVQVRDKRLAAPALAERVRRALVAARRHEDRQAIVIVNDRADIAVATAADGVHVGASDLPTSLARRVVGPHRLIGRTAHATAAAREAVLDGADYLGVGPCFSSVTKSFATYASDDYLRQVAREIGLPAFAIGGITLERIEQLAALGIARVAVASAVTGAADPARAAREIIERLARVRESLHPSEPGARAP